MSDYMVIVESDFRKTNINYAIRRSAALPKAAAEELFQRVISGQEPDLLKPKDNAVVARTADNQVCRQKIIL